MYVMQQLQVFNQREDLKKSVYDCCRIDLCSTYLEQGVTALKTNWKFDQKQSDDAVHLVRAIYDRDLTDKCQAFLPADKETGANNGANTFSNWPAAAL